MGYQASGVKLLPSKASEAELALWLREQRGVAEHFPTISFEACWGLLPLSELEGLACARCSMSHVRFDFSGSHLENILTVGESYPESHHVNLTWHDIQMKECGLRLLVERSLR